MVQLQELGGGREDITNVILNEVVCFLNNC